MADLGSEPRYPDPLLFCNLPPGESRLLLPPQLSRPAAHEGPRSRSGQGPGRCTPATEGGNALRLPSGEVWARSRRDTHSPLFGKQVSSALEAGPLHRTSAAAAHRSDSRALNTGLGATGAAEEPEAGAADRAGSAPRPAGAWIPSPPSCPARALRGELPVRWSTGRVQTSRPAQTRSAHRFLARLSLPSDATTQQARVFLFPPRLNIFGHIPEDP